MMSCTLILETLETTKTIGRLIGNALFPGAIVLLTGDLGAGKTTLSKSICESQGVNPDVVTSPTYTIVNSYPGRLMIHHVDLYRLNHLEDLDNFDRDDLICDEGITLVEWPALLLSMLSDEPQLHLQLEAVSTTQRQLKMESTFPNYTPLLQKLNKAL
ncbi:tRNA (adenosine(37)-N6)-threonylcarbamoyltransferase complex ATPase subunit type 1 TsaE [Deltaproteobacteria bacterium TL4]